MTHPSQSSRSAGIPRTLRADRLLHRAGGVRGARVAGEALGQAERQPFHDPVHAERHHDRRDGEVGDTTPLTSPTAAPARASSEHRAQARARVLAERGGRDRAWRRRSAPRARRGRCRRRGSRSVWPAATKPTNDATTRIALTLLGAREPRVEDRADDEDEDRGAEGDERAAAVGGQGFDHADTAWSPGVGACSRAPPQEAPSTAPSRTATTRNRPWKKDW